MPKKLFEINKFNKGTINNASNTDIEDNTAKYSLNIDPESAVGRLEGINKSRVLTAQGWDSQNVIKGYVTTASLDFSGSVLSENLVSQTSWFNNFGSGISLGAEPTFGATINEMYDDSNTSTTNINNAFCFTLSSIGAELTTHLNNGGSVNGFLFDAGTGSNDGFFQPIRNLRKITFGSSTRYAFDVNDIYHSGKDVPSGTIFYPIHMSFSPGMAFRFTVNEKFFYFYLRDTDGNTAVSVDPQTEILDNDGNDYTHPDWHINYLGSIEIPISFRETRTGNTTSTNIRNIIFTAIKNKFEDSSSGMGLTNYFSSVTQTTTSGSEKLVFNPIPELVNEFKVSLVSNLRAGFQALYETDDGASGWSISNYLSYDNYLFPLPNSKNPLNVNVNKFVTVPNKNNRDLTNFVGLVKNSSGFATHAIKIEDLYSTTNPSISQIGSDFAGTSKKYDMLVNDDKVHIALGNDVNSTPKIALTPEENPLTGGSSEVYDLFESKLISPEFAELSREFSYYYVPPIHGRKVDGLVEDDSGTYGAFDKRNLPLSQKDSTTASKYDAAFWPDYDVVLESDPTFSASKTGGLYSCLKNTSGGTSAIKDLKKGQVFIVQGTTDFADGAMVAWKKYDYDASASAVAAGDLFMFCGYFGNDVPILRYLGNSELQGGTAAFAYAIKNGDSHIYKISLASSSDGDETQFTGASAGTVKDKDANDITITNVGKRVTSCLVPSMPQGISAIYGAQSNTMFNDIGLQGSNALDSSGESTGNYSGDNEELYYGNGHLKYYYRHGVFWIAGFDDSMSLKRINLIDFHLLGVSDTSTLIENFNLNASRIPAQLHAEDENGIIRRTLEDKAHDDAGTPYVHDPKQHNETWSRIPQGARIIGICETFESGEIDSKGATPTALSIGDRVGYKMRAAHNAGGQNDSVAANDRPYRFNENNISQGHDSSPYFQGHPSWRLATGDVVRFAGMDQASDANKAFNRGAPSTVNVVDDGRAIIIEGEEGRTPAYFNDHINVTGQNPVTTGTGDTIWWNSKVWILYGKEGGSAFKDWDLFLYCANTVDVYGDKNLFLADRTVPYSQARYYLNNYSKLVKPWKAWRSDLIDDEWGGDYSVADKVYYPGDSAFAIRNNAGEVSDEDVGEVTDMFADGPDGTDKALASDQFARSGQSIDDADPFRRPLLFSFLDAWLAGDPHLISDLESDEQAPMGWKCEWSVWGIYDKAGRWSKNGKAVRSTHGFKPDEHVDNGLFWNSSYASDDSGQNLNPYQFTNDITPMTWGENIGWEVNDEGISGRTIVSVPGSLHPKNPYSQLYCANRMYYNRQFGGGDDLTYAPGHNANGAEHAVTFLGHTTGKFISRTNPIGRSIHGDGNDNAYDGSGLEVSFYGCLNFNVSNYDQEVVKNYNNTLTLYTIDDFSGHRGSVLYDTTGGVDPSSMDSSDTNLNTYVSGVKMGRPNVGGPEIENPYYYREQMTVGSETRWPFTSKNGGYAGDNNEFDIGWDGYKPPYLFNPGSGYYVYINRRWKNQSPRINALEATKDIGLNVAPDGNIIAHMDAFSKQGSWDYQHDYDANDPFTYSNRRHNFSTTCIGDVVQTHLQSGSIFTAPISTWDSLYGVDEDTDGSILASTRDDLGVWIPAANFYSSQDGIDDGEYLRYKYTRFNTWDKKESEINPHGVYTSTKTFDCNRGIAKAVCTMNDIQVPNILKINNCFPIIMRGNKSGEGTTTSVGPQFYEDFNVSYMCGYDVDALEPKSGIMILRTNWDDSYTRTINNTFMSDGMLLNYAASEVPEFNVNGRVFPRYNMATRQIRGRIGGVNSNADPWWVNNYTDSGFLSSVPFTAKNHGTHFMEIMSITDDISIYGPPDNNNANENGLSVRGASVDNYLTSSIASGLTIFSDSPLKPDFQQSSYSVFTSSLNDFGTSIVQALNSTRSKLLFGIQPGLFQLDEQSDENVTVPSASQGTGAKSMIDSGGSFFTNTSGQIWSGDNDLDIWNFDNTFLSAIPSEASDNGNLEAGNYYYRVSYIYDKQFESPLTRIDAQYVSLTTPEVDGHKYDDITLTLRFPKYKFNDISKRITGVALYRRYGGNIDDNYYHIKEMNFDDGNWVYQANSQSYTYTIVDNGTLGPSYSDLNGIDQNIHDTSLNYGLMARFQGYLYVSQASHPELTDTQNYIYRSQPNNFFAFDWENDFVIMPEQPKGMISFNSRLYVWGENSLYKLDPFSLVIEDEYTGISILNKESVVKTEYGLFFLDKNNIYIHDGNKPNAIGDAILESASKSLIYESVENGTDGYVLLQDGYKELAQQTLDNGDTPSVAYLAKKNSFVAILSNKEKKGVALIYNIPQKRWDMLDAPRIKGLSISKNSDILISDDNYLWNYLDADSIQYTTYNKNKWRWFSKDLTFGYDTQDKIFRGLTFLGTPSVFNYSENSVSAMSVTGATIESQTSSVQVYVDDKVVPLTIQNTFYELTNVGDTYLKTSVDDTTTDIEILTPIYSLSDKEGVGDANFSQAFIRPGHLIKIGDEIMLVKTISEFPQYSKLTVLRAQMSTTATSHTGHLNTSVDIVSPRFKLPSGTKGKKISVRLFEQAGYIDSIGISYKHKGIKL